MKTGVVKFWDPRRGYGFIGRDDGDGDLFGHFTQLCGTEELPRRARVSFEIGTGRRPWAREAKNIILISNQRKSQ